MYVSKHQKASDHLDLLRGIASLFVLWGHLVGVFFLCSYPDINSLSFPTKIFWFLAGLAHPAVILFFVLSGYLISSSIYKSKENKYWSWQWYLLNRGTRLYVVLLPALLLTLAWDQFGIALSNGIMYGGHPVAVIVDRLTPISLIENLLFLKGSFGTNEPLWSLQLEFWCYLLFPLLLESKQIVKFAGACIILIGLIALSPNSLIYLAIWALGVSINFLPRISFSIQNIFLAFGLFLTSLLITYSPTYTYPLINDAFLGVASLGLVYVVSSDRRLKKQNTYNLIASNLSGCSYTLYLAHMPILVFARSLLDPFCANFTPRTLSISVCIFTGILCYSWILARITEYKTADVRAVLKAKTT